jgi:hypothetical protein
MPGGNRMGPMGMGPMTGRRAGYCAGYPAPGYANPGVGRGLAGPMGWSGSGRGWRNRFYASGVPGWAAWGYPYAPAPAQPSREQEREGLKAHAEALEEELRAINERLGQLEQQ